MNAPRCPSLRSVLVAGLVGALVVAACAGASPAALAQSTSSNRSASGLDVPKSTEDRVQSRGWWPTKGDHSRSEFVGPAVCLTCHELKASYKDSAMFHAAAHEADADSLHQESNPLTFKIGAYNYRITASHGKSVLKVSKGDASESVDLLWAFGMGRIARRMCTSRMAGFAKAICRFIPSRTSWTSLPDIRVRIRQTCRTLPGDLCLPGNPPVFWMPHHGVDDEEWIQSAHSISGRDLRSLSRAGSETRGRDEIRRLRSRPQRDPESVAIASRGFGRLLRERVIVLLRMSYWIVR